MDALGTYWMVIATIFVGWLALMIIWCRDGLGTLAARPFSDNNYRWLLLFYLTVIWSGATISAGFGPPILNGYWGKFSPVAIEKAGQLKPSDSTLGRLREMVWGQNTSVYNPQPSVPLAKPKVATLNSFQPAKYYHGWWWWQMAALLWVATIIYLPIAFREEVVETIFERREARSVSGAAESGKEPPKIVVAKGGWNFWKDLMSELSGETLMEIFGKVYRRVIK